MRWFDESTLKNFKPVSDFALSKFPNAGILLLGDANELKLEYLCRGLHLKQVVNIPTTKGGSSLDVICTNLHKFYSQPEALPPLAGSYHYILRMQPLDQIKVEYKVTETLHRPLTDKGILSFGSWISEERWSEVLATPDVNSKVWNLSKEAIW